MPKPHINKLFALVLIVLTILLYKKDEKLEQSLALTTELSQQEISLQQRIEMGLRKNSLIRLQQSPTDIR
ncbi:hypothetical protein MACH07_31010 [Flagellimonas marinaquae]|jgi:hypothetical protein|uniref:Uncharacterized protein n=1 Tax=Flagellimonas marinaquae TaxID=254955 RepID=A0AA48HCB8_9FLAO|nr:hypothetical protein [Allomuricauda sp.]BDW94269.1 hypothetical protein MACH07_31010 [Allomuricauda aquimarina]